MGVGGVGEEVVRLGGPLQSRVMERLEVTGWCGVEDVDAVFIVILVEMISDFVHIFEPHISFCIIEVFTF